MPNDPKWRTIARHSEQRIGDVLAVYVHMMTCASTQPNAAERGRTVGWVDEDIATALDLSTDQVIAIRSAMQGRVLDDDHLSGWEKRQPIREDETAAARAKAWREAQKPAESGDDQTQPNATERNRTLDKIRLDKIKEEVKPKAPAAPKFAPVEELAARGVAPQTAHDWIALRKSKRAVITQTALETIIKEADKAGMSLERALAMCCARGWTGFKAEWAARDGATAGAQQSGKFNFGSVDRSGDQLAQAASMAKHGLTIPDGEVEL
jgi:hypothetical protein